MKRVKGIGGIFFKAENPAEMKNWYEKHLGIPNGPYGISFEWRKNENSSENGHTAWSIFPNTTTYMQPSEKEFMINYRVENLVGLLETLQKEGVEVVGEIQEFEYGKFGWILDPEGQKIELWEPNDTHYKAILNRKHVIDAE